MLFVEIASDALAAFRDARPLLDWLADLQGDSTQYRACDVTVGQVAAHLDSLGWRDRSADCT